MSMVVRLRLKMRLEFLFKSRISKEGHCKRTHEECRLFGAVGADSPFRFLCRLMAFFHWFMVEAITTGKLTWVDLSIAAPTIKSKKMTIDESVRKCLLPFLPTQYKVPEKYSAVCVRHNRDMNPCGNNDHVLDESKLCSGG